MHKFLTLVDNIGYEKLVHDTFSRSFSFIKKDLIFICMYVCVCVYLHVCGVEEARRGY